MTETTPTPAELQGEDWNAYLHEHGYATKATEPDTGAEFAAGWDAAHRRFAAELDARAAILANVREGVQGAREHASYGKSSIDGDLLAEGIEEVLSESPADALAERDARVLRGIAARQASEGKYRFVAMLNDEADHIEEARS